MFHINRSDDKSMGSLGGGCVMMIVAAAIWGISFAIFPKLPGYEKTMEEGELVAGKILRVEEVENVKINDKSPSRIVYEYGDGKQASMTMAMNASAKENSEIQVRVLGEHAYPVGIEPLSKPWWLKFVVIGCGLIGAMLLATGVVKLLLIAGLLGVAVNYFSSRKKSSSGASPPPPPPAP